MKITQQDRDNYQAFIAARDSLQTLLMSFRTIIDEKPLQIVLNSLVTRLVKRGTPLYVNIRGEAVAKDCQGGTIIRLSCHGFSQRQYWRKSFSKITTYEVLTMLTLQEFRENFRKNQVKNQADFQVLCQFLDDLANIQLRYKNHPYEYKNTWKTSPAILEMPLGIKAVDSQIQVDAVHLVCMHTWLHSLDLAFKELGTEMCYSVNMGNDMEIMRFLEPELMIPVITALKESYQVVFQDLSDLKRPWEEFLTKYAQYLVASAL